MFFFSDREKKAPEELKELKAFQETTASQAKGVILALQDFQALRAHLA